MKAASLWLVFPGLLILSGCSSSHDIKVGSKKFTESVILGDMACYLIRDAGSKATHRAQLGSTQFLWQALLSGDIDIYPEYTGTLLKDIVKGNDPDSLSDALAAQGVRMSRPLGFSNSYGLGIKSSTAQRLGIKTISDLRNHPNLRYGFSEEFRKRDDGWTPLQRHYGLNVPENQVKRLDHDLAYSGLNAGELDVIDVYTSEGEILRFDVTVLRDDRQFFTRYDAVWVYRADLPERLRRGKAGSRALAALSLLEGRIDENTMRAMNLDALENPRSESRIAANFVSKLLGRSIEPDELSLTGRLFKATGEHLKLVIYSLTAAIIVAIPLGIFAAKRPVLGQVVLSATSILQTIPSLALLVLLIPILGIGEIPAVAALFVYSLLPIVRNTHAGLTQIPGSVRESAAALGLPDSAVLRLVELPLASRSILAGIKTAAVINVGTATLGALIGAGGYGEAILTGIRLRETSIILEGALPAAVMALLVQGLFEIAERTLTPRGLRVG